MPSDNHVLAHKMQYSHECLGRWLLFPWRSWPQLHPDLFRFRHIYCLLETQCQGSVLPFRQPPVTCAAHQQACEQLWRSRFSMRKSESISTLTVKTLLWLLCWRLQAKRKGGLNDVLQYTRLNTSFIILVQMFQKLPLYLNALGSLHSLKRPGAFVCETD